MRNMYMEFEKIRKMNIDEINAKFLFLGEGISRVVFAIDDNYVIKVSKGREGLYQNRVENYVYTHAKAEFRKYLCPIIWTKPDVIVMPRAIQLSSLTSEKYIDIKTIRPEISAKRDLLHLAKRFYLYYNDIKSVSSWGIVNNIAMLIDYGCTNEEGDRYYG